MTTRAKLKVSAITTKPATAGQEIMSDNYNLGGREPNLQVWNVDLRGDRSLTLRHRACQAPLGNEAEEVLKHVARLWGFAVRMEVAHGDESRIELLTNAARTGGAPTKD